MRSVNGQERILARLSNCGKFLRAFATAFTWKHSVVHQGNDLGYGKNAKDWIIRSQVLRVLHWIYGCCSTTIWQSVPMLILPGESLGEFVVELKIESGPPEMEPWDERLDRPGAYGGLII